MRRLIIALLAVMVALPAVAQVAAPDKPLMIIRFNQRTVYFTKSLQMAVSRAVETKSEVQFALTSIVPQTTNDDHNARYKQLADQHVRQVLREMQSLGVPPATVKISVEPSTALDYDEVHLYAY